MALFPDLTCCWFSFMDFVCLCNRQAPQRKRVKDRWFYEPVSSAIFPPGLLCQMTPQSDSEDDSRSPLSSVDLLPLSDAGESSISQSSSLNPSLLPSGTGTVSPPSTLSSAGVFLLSDVAGESVSLPSRTYALFVILSRRGAFAPFLFGIPWHARLWSAVKYFLFTSQRFSCVSFRWSSLVCPQSSGTTTP